MDTTQQPPRAPPVAGSETEHLVAALDRQRWTFRWKADGLDRAGLGQQVGASSVTLGGLLKHLALVEDYYFQSRLRGEALAGPWEGVDFEADPDWEWRTAAEDSPAALYELYDGAVARSRSALTEALAYGGLDQPVSLGWEHPPSLRRMLFDLVEEYGRHTGHADLLREAVDGRVGEDPPSDWRP